MAIKKIKPYLPPPLYLSYLLSPLSSPTSPKKIKNQNPIYPLINISKQKLPSLPQKKTMKMRSKGKVHPSPSSSSSHYSHNNKDDALSVLRLLPAAILAIASVLSREDREVLAYMITRSLKSTNPSSFLEEKGKKCPKKSSNTSHALKPPLFDCECFDCYTSFWVRWDSSPNRELIHQAIEAFEEHLNWGEQSKKVKNRKKDKMGRRGLEKRLDFSEPEVATGSPEIEEISTLEGPFSPENNAPWTPESADAGQSGEVVESPTAPETALVVRGGAADNHHKGLARKVLPDVLGLLNSRLWNLWSPNV